MSPIIDSHLHVWDGTAAGKDPGPMRVGYSPQASASVELFRDYMDEAGVQKAVFVQPWFYHWDNSYMAACIGRDPDRFRGVCVIDPRGPGAPAELKEWRDRGVTGCPGRLRVRAQSELPAPGGEIPFHGSTGCDPGGNCRAALVRVATGRTTANGR